MPRISRIAEPGAAIIAALGFSNRLAFRVRPEKLPTDAGLSALSRLGDATPDWQAQQDKDALSNEAQHRFANSLQIIASILRHSLRDTETITARREIEAAYQRIMAVAELQRALFETHGMVAVAPYLQGIGQRIRNSFLVKDGNVAIRVLCSPTTLEAQTATNLGLVVTELLINAIKHAFPDGRSGVICVNFRCRGRGWILSVSDNGIGRTEGVRQGFGSLIVPALALQLNAKLTERRMRSGTCSIMTGDLGGVPQI